MLGRRRGGNKGRELFFSRARVPQYHLRDVVIGKIYFILVRIRIKHMEVAIVKRESTVRRGGKKATPAPLIQLWQGSGTNLFNESENLIKYEIMDGAPVRGESIPVRLFLNSCLDHLTPTYRNVHTKFSVKYYLNLVLVDEEERRYFKQQEIILWRKPPRKKGEAREMAGRYERPEDALAEQARKDAQADAEARLIAQQRADEAQ